MIQRILAGLAPVLFLVVIACGQSADWPVAPPPSEGLDSAVLSQMDAHIREQLPHLRSLLIARHGKLVFEQYYGGASRDQLQNLQSMTKSITSALTGIALKKGLIPSLDKKVLDYFPEYRDSIADPRMAGITVRNLLAMSSGIDEMQLSFDKAFADPIHEILRRPLIFNPAHGFRYSSAGAHILGGVLLKATGKTPLDSARVELFQPLGMGRVEWYADKNGLQSGGMSGLFRAPDMLKFGELYLRRGQWNGAEIIPAAYVDESTRVQNTGEFYGERARYGLMWWIGTVNGYDGYYARGYGGQYLMVLPKADMVILCTSDWKQPEYPEHFALIGKFILPAIEPAKPADPKPRPTPPGTASRAPSAP